MQKLTKEQLIARLEIVERNLRACNSGTDVHHVGNMRNVAVGIRQLLEDYKNSGHTIDQCVGMLERLEKTQVEFFKKKFQHLRKRH